MPDVKRLAIEHYRRNRVLFCDYLVNKIKISNIAADHKISIQRVRRIIVTFADIIRFYSFRTRKGRYIKLSDIQPHNDHLIENLNAYLPEIAADATSEFRLTIPISFVVSNRHTLRYLIQKKGILTIGDAIHYKSDNKVDDLLINVGDIETLALLDCSAKRIICNPYRLTAGRY